LSDFEKQKTLPNFYIIRKKAVEKLNAVFVLILEKIVIVLF